MASITETKLPGIGVRSEFTTGDGRPIGVIAHRDGEHDLLLFDRKDPDSCKATIRLTGEDTVALIDALGGSTVVIQQAQAVQQSLEGIEFEWVPLTEDAPCAGRTIAETEMRRRTGASIVSILRGDDVLVSPPSDYRLEVGDTAVIVGSEQTTADARRLLLGA